MNKIQVEEKIKRIAEERRTEQWQNINKISNSKGLNDKDKTFLNSLGVPDNHLKAPIEYSELKKEEKEKKIDDMGEVSKILLTESIKFYNEHYPNTENGLVWNAEKINIEIGAGILEAELSRLSEIELFGIQAIFDYCHDERLIKSIIDHNKMQYISAKINSIIPGFQNKIKLKKLINSESLIQKQKKDLQIEIEKDQEKFALKIKKINTPELVPKPTFPCPDCDKVCKSKGGLMSHIKTHEY